MKPLLAATVERPDQLRYPYLASPKLDGIRCLWTLSPRTGTPQVLSRSLKLIPNNFIRQKIRQANLPTSLDGELIVGKTFQETTSAVMSHDGEPQFEYHIFDIVKDTTEMRADSRYGLLTDIYSQYRGYPWLKIVPQTLVRNHAELDAYETETLAQGYEGVMLKSPNARYKCGRSTLLENCLLKLKRFTDADAKVIGFTELMHNDNLQETNALGLAERSSNQENLVPGNTLGALVVSDTKTHIHFNIGTGFTAAQRYEIWANREHYLGKVLTYKYQNHGIKVAPRSPVFLRWREDHKL